MKIRTLSILALAAFAATACKKSDTSEGAATTDTTVVPGTDTTTATVVAPTTDTVVTTTTSDTVHGTVPDTTVVDTTKKM